MTHRIFSMPFGTVYPLYLAKVERKGRSKDELDAVIGWLTGYDAASIDRLAADGTTFTEFFAGAHLTPHTDLITGVICGVRVETIEDPLMQQIRWMGQTRRRAGQGPQLGENSARLRHYLRLFLSRNPPKIQMKNAMMAMPPK